MINNSGSVTVGLVMIEIVEDKLVTESKRAAIESILWKNVLVESKLKYESSYKLIEMYYLKYLPDHGLSPAAWKSFLSGRVYWGLATNHE